MNRVLDPSSAKRRSRALDDAGAALIEAIAAAAIFAMVSLAVLAGIDGASGSSGREKARTVAGALAEQDQERMRAMRAVDLSNYNEVRSVTVGGGEYKIASEATWISDSTGGTVSCTADAKQVDYLRIRTVVTSPIIGTRAVPVRIDSLVAPPVGALTTDQGTLAVQVNDRDDKGVQGIRIEIEGPTSVAEYTNEVGCAIFQLIPPGSYHVKANENGRVDPQGVQAIDYSGTVASGATNLTTIRYDLAGQLSARFDTRYKDPNDSQYKTVPSSAWSLSLANAGIKTGVRLFGPTSAPGATVSATQLFPFKDPYGIYSGKCIEEAPGVVNGGLAQRVDPAGIYNVVVRQPALWLRVRNGSTSGNRTNGPAAWVSDANVIATLVTQTGSQCVPAEKLTLTTSAQPGLVGFVSKPAVTGMLYDPGLPYGRWSICADYGGRKATAVVDNVAMGGVDASPTVINVWPQNGAVSGKCT